MTKYQYRVVSVGPAIGLVPVIGSALAPWPEFCALPDARTDDTARDADALILATAQTALVELLDRISALRLERPECALLVVGEGFDVEQLTAIFGAGAHDFIATPIAAGEFAARLRHALGLVPEGRPPDVRTVLNPRLRGFIGESAAFAKQVAKLPMLAGCDAGVLILGETGTGKEVCARAIHYLSARASRPWVAVNCGAVPLELVESELFGHARGAYTTAHAAREGLVTEAEGGTLFLDDVDCIPMAAQSKLLRFLQEHEYRPVGTNAVRHADVRVIAASNRNMAELVTRGGLRQDLYYRLNVLTLMLPPLRERRGDICALASHFVSQYASKAGRAVPALSPQAMKKLLEHDWPGNVRELQHVIERALVMSSGRLLSAEDIDIAGAAELMGRDESFRIAKAHVIQQFERSYIEHLLAICGGNITHAAIEARKDRRAFFALIRKHHIEPQRFRSAK